MPIRTIFLGQMVMYFQIVHLLPLYQILRAGQYTVDITDNNGCQLFSGGTVNQPAELYLSYSKTNKQCGGGVNNGSIDLSVFGGTHLILSAGQMAQ